MGLVPSVTGEHCFAQTSIVQRELLMIAFESKFQPCPIGRTLSIPVIVPGEVTPGRQRTEEECPPTLAFFRW
jgi:hypothetical protein